MARPGHRRRPRPVPGRRGMRRRARLVPAGLATGAVGGGTSAGGAGLILRAMGGAAPHPLGSVGVQYVVWTAAGEEDLARCERALAGRGAHRGTRSHDGVTLVEGRDPDDMVVMVSHPGPDQVPLRELPVRIYG